MAVTRAGSASYSTSTSSDASSAAVRVAATTHATKSPSKRTLAVGIGSTVTGCNPSMAGAIRSGAAQRAMSCPSITAAAASMARMRAWACGVRTNRAWSAPGNAMSSR